MRQRLLDYPKDNGFDDSQNPSMWSPLDIDNTKKADIVSDELAEFISEVSNLYPKIVITIFEDDGWHMPEITSDYLLKERMAMKSTEFQIPEIFLPSL